MSLTFLWGKIKPLDLDLKNLHRIKTLVSTSKMRVKTERLQKKMKQSNQSKNFFFKCAMGVLYICMAENEIYTMDCGDFKSNSFLFYL